MVCYTFRVRFLRNRRGRHPRRETTMTHKPPAVDCGCEIGENDCQDIYAVSVDGTDSTFCDACADNLRATIEDASACTDCGAPGLGSWERDGILGAPSWSDFTVTIGEQSWTILSDYREADGDLYCDPCFSVNGFDYCESCEESGSGYTYCESCEVSYCSDYSCEDTHAECGGQMGGLSLTVALGAIGTPGDVILSTRAAGYEIERNAYGSNVSSAARDLIGAGLLLESHGEHCGHEYVLLPMRGRTLEQGIGTAYRILAAHGATGTDDCGLHLHLDMTGENDRARRAIVGALRIVEPVLYAVAASHRWDSTYCHPSDTGYTVGIREGLTSTASVDHAALGQRSRFCGVNLHAISAHGTVELRMLDGTTDVERTTHFAALATGVADLASTIGPDALLDYIGAPLALLHRAERDGYIAPATRDYVVARYGSDPVRVERASRIATEKARRARTEEMNARIAEARATFNAILEPLDDVRRTQVQDANDRLDAARLAFRRAEEEYRAARDDAYAAYRDATAPTVAAQDAAEEAIRAEYRA